MTDSIRDLFTSLKATQETVVVAINEGNTTQALGLVAEANEIVECINRQYEKQEAVRWLHSYYSDGSTTDAAANAWYEEVLEIKGQDTSRPVQEVYEAARVSVFGD